jgi:hypothetical protein
MVTEVTDILYRFIEINNNIHNTHIIILFLV